MFWTSTVAPFLWSGIINEFFEIVEKTDDEIDKWKSSRIGLQMVREQNLSIYPGSSSGLGEYVGVVVSKSLKSELSVTTGGKIQFAS